MHRRQNGILLGPADPLPASYRQATKTSVAVDWLRLTGLADCWAVEVANAGERRAKTQLTARRFIARCSARRRESLSLSLSLSLYLSISLSLSLSLFSYSFLNISDI